MIFILILFQFSKRISEVWKLTKKVSKKVSLGQLDEGPIPGAVPALGGLVSPVKRKNKKSPLGEWADQVQNKGQKNSINNNLNY